MKAKIRNLLLALFSFLPLLAQVQKAPEWQVTANKDNPEPGDEIVLTFSADVPQDWYMYSSDFDPDLGPMLTEFRFDASAHFELSGELKPLDPKEKHDELWEGKFTYFTDKAVFNQKIKLASEQAVITGVISYQICSDVTGQCIPYESDFSIDLFGNAAGAASQAAKVSGPSTQPPLRELGTAAGRVVYFCL